MHTSGSIATASSSEKVWSVDWRCSCGLNGIRAFYLIHATVALRSFAGRGNDGGGPVVGDTQILVSSKSIICFKE